MSWISPAMRGGACRLQNSRRIARKGRAGMCSIMAELAILCRTYVGGVYRAYPFCYNGGRRQGTGGGDLPCPHWLESL